MTGVPTLEAPLYSSKLLSNIQAVQERNSNPIYSSVLSTLLGCAKTPSEAVTALKVYDQVRRPRTHRIVESSHGTGMIMRGRGKDIGLDLGKLREKLLPRRDFIVDYDNEKHLKKAVEIMKGELKG